MLILFTYHMPAHGSDIADYTVLILHDSLMSVYLSIYLSIYLRVSIAVKRQHELGNSYKRKTFNLRLAYSFRGLDYYHHDRKHGSVQAEVILERELRVLHYDL